MGSLRAELKRFERRRLRPILRRLRRSRQALDKASQPSAPMEQLLVALVRSEIRRTHARPSGWSFLTTPRHGRTSGGRMPAAGELEGLVRSMLATPAPARPDDRREAG